MSKAKPDREAFIKALMAALLAFMIWSMLTQRQKPPPPGTDGGGQQTTPASTIAASLSATMPEGFSVAGQQTEQVLDLGNVVDERDESAYRMHLHLSNRGASLIAVWLTDYDEKVNGEQRYQIIEPVEVPGEDPIYSFTTGKVNINVKVDENQNYDIPLARQFWNFKQQETAAGQQVVFWVDILKDNLPLARVSKTYTLNRQERQERANALGLSLQFENLSSAPLKILATQWGTVGVPKEDPRTDNRKITAGIRTESSMTLTQYPPAKVAVDKPQPLFELGAERLEWLALANKFFAVIVAPLDNSAAEGWISRADAFKVTADEEEHDDATFELVTTALDLQAGASRGRSFDCYLGPKAKPLFTSNAEYVARDYVQLINEDYYWCAFAPIVNLMLWLLNTSYKLIPNYGVAIIVMVLIVRTLLHPLTKKGQVNMTRMAQQMSVLQPKMEEIRKKYANDKQRLNQEMMKLYQEKKINPAGQMLTCLPMMCQMPIWGGLWAALNFTVELRHQPFYLWIHDLTAPDALYTFAAPLPLLGDSLNILPPLLGVGMWLQQRLMPKPAAATRQTGKTGDQMAQQRMMMTFMSIFMVVIFYRAPAGLTLYIMASNFFGLVEQYFIRKHLREEEQRPKPPPGEEPSSKIKLNKPKFWQKLEKMADEAKQQR